MEKKGNEKREENRGNKQKRNFPTSFFLFHFSFDQKYQKGPTANSFYFLLHNEK